MIAAAAADNAEELATLADNVREAGEDFDRALEHQTERGVWAAFRGLTKARAELERVRREMGEAA